MPTCKFAGRCVVFFLCSQGAGCSRFLGFFIAGLRPIGGTVY